MTDSSTPATESEAVQSEQQQQELEDEARRAKIEAIRQQLASGSYLISGKDVAGKILEVIRGESF